MGKKANKRLCAENQARANIKMIRVSPSKLNDVAGLIRGKSVNAALTDLTFCRKRVAGIVKKALESAISNAENNHQLDVDQLFVRQATVGKRMVMRRYRARARGRAASIEKFFSSIDIIVEERQEEAA